MLNIGNCIVWKNCQFCYEKVSFVGLEFFMAAYCYILYSVKLDRFYIGACQEDLLARIEKHNNHFYGRHRFTAVANDWSLFISIEANDFSHAVRMERKIKSMKSSKYIHNLKKYPDLLDKIVNQTSN